MKNKKYIQLYLALFVTILGVGGTFADMTTVKTYLENLRNSESGQVGYILGEIFYGTGSIKEGKIKQEYLDLEGLSGGSSSGGGVTSVNTKTGSVVLTKSDVGLGNVDNTSDVNKPVSTPTQTALNLKANLASPALTGTPTAPTASAGTNNTQIATTAFVKSQGYITSSNSVTSVNTKTGSVVLTKSDVGLSSVDDTADVNKNVLSATKLTTARTIAGVSFNGTANISIPFSGLSSKPTTLAGYGITDAQSLIAAGTTAQYYRGDKTWATLNSASISDATNANTVNMIVKRDASGNFSAGTITASLNGNAASATKLTTARTINGVSFNGTANITLPTVNTSGDQTIGGIKTFTGNVIGATPTASNHLTTKAYVDSVVGSSQTLYEPTIGTGTTAQYYRGDKTWATLNTAVVPESGNLYFSNARAQASITGGASTITTSNLTASRALVSDASGKVGVSSVTSTQLGYLAGVTSAVQTQLNGKAPLASPALTGVPTAPTAAVGTNTTQIATTAFVIGQGYATINGSVSSVNSRTGAVVLTKSDVGLSSVDNTADSAKNVLSATKLTTARTINGVSFNGTANITLSTVNLNGDQTITGIKTFTGNVIGATPTASNHLTTKAYVDSVVGSSQTLYEPTIGTGTTAQYYRGDKTWATLNTAVVPESGNLYFSNARAQASITGGASTITTSNLTASRALVSDASGKVGVSSVTSTQLGYLAGVTSAVQTQLNGKANLASPALTGVPTAPTAAAGTNSTQIATTAFVIGQGYATINGSVSSVNSRTGAVVLTKSDVGLGSVDNTADSAKNVLSATKLTTARTIAGVSFNGTANIAIPFSGLTSKPTTLAGYGITDAQGLITAGTTSQYYRGDKTWATLNSAAISDATNANTANMIVKRDASGNFSAGTITASLNGNAASATKLTTARTINGVSFNGTANITLPTVNLSGDQEVFGQKFLSKLVVGNPGTATGSASLQFLTDTSFGTGSDKHTGIRMFSYDMTGGWGTAKLGVQVSNEWGSYFGGNTPAKSDLAMVIGQNETLIKGNVGIGVISPQAKLEVAGNVVADTPTASNHLATKAYVDTVAVASAASANSSNLQPAGTFFNTGGNPFYCQQTGVTSPGYKYSSVTNIGKICDQGDVDNIKLCSTQGTCSDGATTLKIMNGTGTLSVGYNHVCAVREDGKVLCWGRGDSGGLGDGTTYSKPYATLVSGANNNNFISVAAGLNFTCGLKNDGKVWCWGYNYYGQLGDGTQNQSLVPVLVSGANSNFIKITAGMRHICGLKSDGTIYCWGANDSYQGGNYGSANRTSPTALYAYNSSFIDVTAGQNHTCGLKSDGRIWCWGYNANGQVGESSYGNYPYPYQVSATVFSKIFAFHLSTCGIVSGVIQCIGERAGNTHLFSTIPGANNTNFNDMTITTYNNICGVRSNGDVYCSAAGNVSTTLFSGSENYTLTNIKKGSISSISDTGYNSQCFQNYDNTVSCYGSPSASMLGSNNSSVNQFFKSYVITPN